MASHGLLSISGFVFCVKILLLLMKPTIAFLKFDLSPEELIKEHPLYKGSSSDEVIALCRYSSRRDDFIYSKKDYNFNASNCTANIITLNNTTALYQLYRAARQEHLEKAVVKAIGFKRRLSWPPIQFIVQMIFFFVALFCGIFLWLVGHFDMRSHYVEFFIDPTKGIPGKVFVAKVNNYWIHYWPPPDYNDPDYDSYIFEESDAWSTVNESDDERPKPKIPEQIPGEPPIELTPEELEYIRKNAEFDEHGYPFEYRDEDIEGDAQLLAEYDARIEAANAIIIADAAKKNLPYWRTSVREPMSPQLESLPGAGLMDINDKNSLDENMDDFSEDELAKIELEDLKNITGSPNIASLS